MSDSEKTEKSDKSANKLEKVRSHHSRMLTAIIKAVEAKHATASLYGLRSAEEALATCLTALRAEVRS